jgi:hypothetical protein
MPTVPQDRNRVAIEPLPNARSNAGITPEAYGAGIGRGLTSLGSVVTDYAQKEQQKQDTAALMSAERELQQWQNQALFAPETGAFAQRGQNAFGVPEKLMPEWDKRVGDVESKLTENQRRVFRQRAGDMRVSMERDLMRHVGSEAEQFQKQETAALVTTRLDTAMLYWQDPARFDKEMREAQQVFLAGNPSIPPAAAEVGLRAIESQARAGVVNKMMESDPLAAQRYYDTYRDTLNEADRAQVERVLNPARKAAEADQAVARVKGRAVPGAVPPSDFATYRRALESGGRADARNPESSATGADQFIESTWISMVDKTKPAWANGLSRAEVLALRTDPAKSAEMADALTQENAKTLQAAGQAISNENLYAAHHFGDRKGIAFAKASLDTPMEQILTPEQLAANGYLKGKTKAEAIANWNRRAGATVGDAPAAPLAKADALSELNQIKDPEVRRLALAQYRTEIEIENVRKAEQTEAFVEEINTAVEASDPSMPLNKVLSKEQYAWAVEQGKLPLWEQRQENRLKGLETKTDPNLFDALQTVFSKAENGDAAALAEVRKMDTTKLYASLDRQARDYVQNRRAAIMASGKKTEAPEFATEEQLLEQEVFGKLGIEKNPQKDDTPETKATRYAFMQSYWAATELKQKEVGRKLTSAERQQVMKDLLLPFARTVRDQSVASSLNPFDDDKAVETKRGFEIGPVPALDRQQIVEAYRSVYGVVPTEAAIRAEYLRAQGYKPQLETE